MFENLKTRLSREKSHLDDLGDVVKHLLYSYILYLISYPIIGIFINVFFWRQSNDITLIAAYNLGFFLALPLGFYLNGLLLKRFNILKLYWVGTVLQGLAAFLAIFFPSLSFYQVLLYGLIYGIGGGLYWSNKNYITLKITKGRNRLYYNSLEASIDLIINIIMPIILGWIIVLGEVTGVYAPETAYKVLMVLCLFMLWFSGYILQSANIYSEKITHIAVAKPSKYWNLNRIILCTHQLLSGINFFVPTFLVLLFVGAEGAIGTIESATAVLVAIMLYWVGRKTAQRHSFSLMLATSTVFLLGSILYNLTYGVLGALIYSLTCSLTGALSWNIIYTNSMEVMDREIKHGHNHNQYALIFDNELFFNIGRIMGMGIFFGLSYFTSQEISLRITPIFAGILQFAMLVPLSYLLKYTSSSQSSSINSI